MAAGIGLQLAVNNYTLNVCKALRDCESPKDIEDVLQNLLLFVCLSTDQTDADLHSNTTAPDSPLAMSYARVFSEVQSVQNAALVVAASLFHQLETITFSLLAVAATAAPKSKAIISLLQDLFQAAPAAAALQALTSYIGSVVPVQEEVDTLRPRTQALGTDLAASILAQRFASPTSSGIPQLCKEISAFHTVKPVTGFLPLYHSVAEAMPDQVTAALVSVVERSTQCSQQSLTPQTFIPHVVHQFAAIARSSSSASHTCSDTSTEHTGDQRLDLAVAMTFMGEVCGRFCRRGYASIVAETCWQLLQEESLCVHNAQTGAFRHQCGHDHQQQQQQQQQKQQPQPQTKSSDDDVQQQQQQQQQQQPQLQAKSTDDNVQQQQEQQGLQEQPSHQPDHITSPTQETAALPASSFQTSLSQQAACLLIHAVQDATAVDKLLICLLQSASSNLQQLDRHAALLHSVIQPIWVQDSVRLLLYNKLLLHSTVSLPSLVLLIQLLDMLHLESGTATQPQRSLVGVTSTLAEVWSDKGFCTRVALKQQAYITCALAMCIAKTGRGCLERTQGLLPAVLQGVSARLDNPVEAIRALDPNKPLLFGDFPLEILEEEVWHPSARRLAWQDPLTGLTSDLTPDPTPVPGSSSDPAANEQTRGIEQPGEVKSNGSPGQANGWSSDQESDSDDSLQPFDLAEEDDEGLDSGERPMQLRDLAAALRKSEDVNDKLRALKNLEGALLAAPDELKHHAGELARALLHVRAPDWADEEARRPEDKPQVQRYRSMVALLVTTPEVAGAAFTSELYSPHLDVHQRMLILETLASAAQQMANPRARIHPGNNQINGSALEAGAEAATNAALGAHEVGRTRRWGFKALQKQRQQQQQQLRPVDRATPGNAFPAVALPWAAALLRECDVERHGVDLFNRDPLLLGRLLITLGTFVECVGSAPVVVQLAACMLELVRSPGVHAHPQPYIRRAALLASAQAGVLIESQQGVQCLDHLAGHFCTSRLELQVVATLPPARLAAAMTGSLQAGSIDSVLMEQLQWLQHWAADTASNDVDAQCQQLASACGNLQGGLAASALETLEAGSQNVHQGLPGLPNMQSPAMLIGAVQLGTIKF